MNEQKKLYIILGGVVAIIILMLGINFINEYNSKKHLEKFEETLVQEEKQMILIGREGCSYCQMFTPLLEYMRDQYGFEYLYIDTDKITNKGLNSVIEKLDIDPDDFGTPHLSIVQAGNVIDSIPGYVDEQELLTFLKENGYADKNASVPLNYLTFESYKEIIKSNTPEVIVIGQTGCGYCMLSKPALLSIADKYNVKINYLNMTDLSDLENSEQILEQFNTSLSYLSEEEWGTPLMLVVKDGKVIGHSNGFVSEDTYVEFLKEKGIIGE